MFTSTIRPLLSTVKQDSACVYNILRFADSRSKDAVRCLRAVYSVVYQIDAPEGGRKQKNTLELADRYVLAYSRTGCARPGYPAHVHPGLSRAT